MLNDELHDFLSNKTNFDRKNQLDEKIAELLQSFRDNLIALLDRKGIPLPVSTHKAAAKATKGNLHYGYPFQVLDFPAQFEKQHIYTFRTVVWYGHHFSFNLILSGTFLKNHRPNWQVLLDKEFLFSCGENIWKEPLKDTEYIEITHNNHTLLTEKTSMCKEIRVSKRFNLNQLPHFHRLGMECFEAIVCSNTDLA
ncbi:hypothetical protein [Roseivirga pacifica]